MTEYRLGDLIDDYCPRCRLLLNHAVASLVGDEVAKVICQTCYSEHPYRHGEGGKKKKPASGRHALFGQVLAKVQSPAAPQASPPADPPEGSDQSPKKKKSAILTRYITRHRTKPPRKGQ
jgi:hypothetical protein